MLYFFPYGQMESPALLSLLWVNEAQGDFMQVVVCVKKYTGLQPVNESHLHKTGREIRGCVATAAMPSFPFDRG